MSDVHNIFMKYYGYDVFIDRMTGKRYRIDADKQIQWLE